MPSKPVERVSAGLLMYRLTNGALEILLAHPGGPFFARKDDGHWSVPKGEPNRGESDLLTTACREFEEEIGLKPESGEFIPLGSIRQKGGKTVHAWAFPGDLPPNHAHQCNSFSMEWPPRSGQLQEFPEIDKACFFTTPEARVKIKETQLPFIDRLEVLVRGKGTIG